MRRRDRLDPDVERELAVLDDPSGPVAPDLAQLAELARAVRAERPAPGEPFAARLDAWAASGFSAEGAPSGRRPTRSRRPALSRRALLPALGAAASLAVAVGIATSLVSDDEQPPALSPAGSAPEGGASAGRGGAIEPQSTQSLTAPPTGDEAVAPGRPRRVERQASLVLAAPRDEVANVSDRVVRVTDEVGGIVASSSVSSGERDGGAIFELRVPTRRLDDALARLSRLAHVRSRTQSSLDVTASFVNARERLDEALTERRALLRQLAAADTANETASLRERLRIVRGEIRAARASLSRVRLRTDYSRVSVSVQSDGRGGVGGGRWTPGDAARDAVRVLEVLAGAALVSVAVLAPMMLLGGAAVLAGGALRRRRRDQALSAS